MAETGRNYDPATWTLHTVGVFTIAYRVESHSMDFILAQQTAWSDDGKGNYTVPEYERRGGMSSMDMTLDIADAEYFADGFVRWDGCSHWSFHTEDCMAHMCGFADLKQHTRAMEEVFHLAAKHLPTFDADCAQYPAEPPHA